jgi:hypothetical protein
MLPDNLKEKAAAFAQTQQDIEASRKLWSDTTKPLLKATLETIAKETAIGLHVQVLDWSRNSEAVSLTFGIRPSGIVEKTNTGAKSFMKHGGRINFSQAYNGEVFVLIAYPYVDERVTQAELKTVGRYNPRSITEPFIYEMVEQFLNEMITWEKASSSTQIGFTLGK